MYTKMLRIGKEEVIYYANNKKEDDNYIICNKFREQFGLFLNAFPVLEKNDVDFYDDNQEDIKRINKYYKNLFIVKYNSYGEVIKEKKGIVVNFDFDKEVITFSNGNKTRSYKVTKNNKYLYTYKFNKKSIRAINGIEGLYKVYFEYLHSKNQYITSIFTQLENILSE